MGTTMKLLCLMAMVVVIHSSTIHRRTIIVNKPQDQKVAVGSTAIFRCTAEVDPDVTREVSWEFKGSPIVFKDSRMQKLNDDSLHISATAVQDSGTYACVVKTPHDEARAEALLTVQAPCALPYDAGTCANYILQWYYDMQYGGCSRFHYGGCEGNGNRFANKAECEDVCVHPTGKDICNLPKVKGSCGDQVTRWHYDTNQGCQPFTYGGCLGNANNFVTRELCEKQCVPELNPVRRT